MRIYIQLGAQTLDMRIDRAVIARELIAPYHRQQIVPRKDAPRRAGKRIKQLDLAACKIELMPSNVTESDGM